MVFKFERIQALSKQWKPKHFPVYSSQLPHKSFLPDTPHYIQSFSNSYFYVFINYNTGFSDFNEGESVATTGHPSFQLILSIIKTRPSGCFVATA